MPCFAVSGIFELYLGGKSGSRLAVEEGLVPGIGWDFGGFGSY